MDFVGSGPVSKIDLPKQDEIYDATGRIKSKFGLRPKLPEEAGHQRPRGVALGLRVLLTSGPGRLFLIAVAAANGAVALTCQRDRIAHDPRHVVRFVFGWGYGLWMAGAQPGVQRADTGSAQRSGPKRSVSEPV